MYDIIVIGCGISGASLAYKLSRYRLNILVLEKENDVAMGTTKANSAIVHAGYDPLPGTLMAKLNIEGSRQMEALCKELDVLYRKIGSMVLAFDETDRDTLQQLYRRGLENGVEALQLLTGDEARQMEPKLSEQVVEALYAPTAAIVDPWGLCIAQAETAVKNGTDLKLDTEVVGLENGEDYLVVHTNHGDFKTRYAVNCTGTHGSEISSMMGQAEWEDRPIRGEYYLLDKQCGNLVSHVIFQCPSKAGKGVLTVPTVHGNIIVGPTADPIDDPDNTATTSSGLEKAAAASRKSIPSINLRQSIRNFSGVRATTSEPDFIIRPSKHNGRLLHICGIKSPGLSAAPAIADYAMEKLQEMGLSLTEKDNWNGHRRQIRFKSLPLEEKKKLIQENPLYGRVICRCETITEGEIVAAVHSPIPPCSLDGVKRRAGSGMGRCQGGFCGPKVMEILSRELGKDPKEIPQDGAKTQLILGRTKGE